ncbi:phytanoyl-CoA dioxygenase family protein [Chondromyces apiculatus]|uniref:Phytanoyl-CoA dioxygenase family protein n=1 Tax=Chondromyces apiculatus DSM 436 TaxID=1192034 RepID=A0A017SYA5_9BACT|nr:phytanoyl-CoA dioxygenase family protein [Chondromyces apiculatus]EYF01757.1 Hypothetical protein CAP_7823 [Chondromyces apiculatus DSM 436]
MLDEGSRRAFAEEGYLVLPDAVPREACEALCAHVSDLILRVAGEHARGERGVSEEAGFWASLRRSAHEVEVFLDPAVGPPRALPPESWERAVTRIGHGLHRVDAQFGALCRSEAVAGPLAAITPEPAVVVQTAVIYKQPRSEVVQFGFHQDSWYLSAEPDTLVLAFVALDDMDEENGCLAVIPGSHREGLGTRLVLGDKGYVSLGRTQGLPAPRHPERAVLLPAAKGTIILAHGRTYHASGPNRSDRPRRAFIAHALGAGSRMQASSWIQAPPGGFTRLAEADEQQRAATRAPEGR